MIKCLNAWTVNGSTPFEDMFAQLKAAGFDAVELNVDAPGASPHALSMESSNAELSAVRALSEKYALPVVSVSTSLYAGKMGSPNPADRAFAQKVLDKQLAVAAALGAGGILAVPGGITNDVSIDRARALSLETLREMVPQIAAQAVNVGLENVWNGFFTSPYDMTSFIDELACERVGAYFDAGNVAAFSWPEYWIPVLGRRIKNVHVKGFARAGGRINRGGTFCDLSECDIRWGEVARALSAVGFDGALTAEVSIPDALLAGGYPAYYAKVAKEIGDIIGEEHA